MAHAAGLVEPLDGVVAGTVAEGAAAVFLLLVRIVLDDVDGRGGGGGDDEGLFEDRPT
jgi:hypothetical protein